MTYAVFCLVCAPTDRRHTDVLIETKMVSEQISKPFERLLAEVLAVFLVYAIGCRGVGLFEPLGRFRLAGLFGRFFVASSHGRGFVRGRGE
jgi:hypothetical protein